MTAVYLFGTVLVVLIVAVIIAPIVEERGRPSVPEGDGQDAAARLEEALEALRRLEFDFQSGKVDDRDYGPLRRRYAALAIAARDELGQADTEAGTSVAATCVGCGEALPGSEKFCTTCGRPVAVPAAGA